MDLVIKFLHTLFFGIITYFIVKKYNSGSSIKTLYIVLLSIYFIILFSLNSIFTVIPNKLLFILVIFSFSIFLLNIIKEFVGMERNTVLRNNSNLTENYKNIKSIIFEKIIPILIYLYQLILIWVPAVFEKMSQKH